jgi:hypothetical protein
MRSVEKLILTVVIVRSRSVAGRLLSLEVACCRLLSLAVACCRLLSLAVALLSLAVALLCQNRLAYKTGFTKSKTGYLINF